MLEQRFKSTTNCAEVWRFANRTVTSIVLPLTTPTRRPPKNCSCISFCVLLAHFLFYFNLSNFVVYFVLLFFSVLPFLKRKISISYSYRNTEAIGAYKCLFTEGTPKLVCFFSLFFSI